MIGELAKKRKSGRLRHTGAHDEEQIARPLCAQRRDRNVSPAILKQHRGTIAPFSSIANGTSPAAAEARLGQERLAFLFCSCSTRKMRALSSPPVAATPIHSFTPVPLRARRDGWTVERQRRFVAALARAGCVGRAAAAAGMSRESAYRLRRRPGAESFAAAWDSIMAARPRGSTGFDLTWHRMIERVGGTGARVRREGEAEAAAPASGYKAALHRLMGERGRSQ